MEKLVFKFKRVEDDHMIAFRALKKERFGNTELTTMEQWSHLQHEAFVPLIHWYLEADKMDEVSKYVLDQWDSGTNGFHLFEQISDALVAKNDKQRLAKFWARVVISRLNIDHRTAAGEAVKLMRIALEKFGDASAADEMQAKLDRKKTAKVNSAGKQQQVKVKDAQQQSDMTQAKFWELIESAKNAYPEPADVELRVDQLRTQLSNLDVEQVRQFAEILQQKMNQSYTWDLWAIAYIAFGGCSDDCFDYFRGWLISEGKVTFEKVVQNPEIVVELGSAPDQLESMLYVPEEVLSEITDDKLELTEPKLSEPAGVEWEESEEALEKRFPKAYAFFQ